MSANAWLIIAVISFSLAGISLVTAVIFFIRFRIISVIGDLTGRTVAKEVERIRLDNENSGDKRFRSSTVNANRGTLTDVVEGAAKSQPVSMETDGRGRTLQIGATVEQTKETATEELKEAGPTEVLEEAGPTEVLEEARPTEVLAAGPTEVLEEAGPTEVLEEAGPTEVLEEARPTEVLAAGPTEVLTEKGSFIITKSIISVHTDEEIELK